MNTPMLSVCLITYNHEKYIRQAIESVLMQKVNFLWELIIADDFSTDKTRAILLEYKEKHPDLIKLILQEKNIGAAKNWMDLMLAPESKYIAYVDGDDYWTDPLKLQKQVDFLESNPEYILSCHDAFLIDESGRKLNDVIIQEKDKKELSKKQLMNGAFLMPQTMCFKNVIHEFPPEVFLVKNGDTFFISMLGQHGKSMYQNDILPTGYRIHSGGIWSKMAEEKKIAARIETFFIMFRYYRRINIDKQTTKNYYTKYSQFIIRILDVQLSKKRIFQVVQGLFWLSAELP